MTSSYITTHYGEKLIWYETTVKQIIAVITRNYFI